MLVVGLLVWSGAGAGIACEPDETDSDRYYWYEEQQVAQAQAEGITGHGVPVAVIDLAVGPDMPELADAHLTVREPSFCGEQVLADNGREPIPAAQNYRSMSAWNSTLRLAFIVGNGRGSDGQESVRGVAPGADIRFYAVGTESPASNVVCAFQDSALRDEGRAATARAIVQAVDDGARIIVLYDQDPRFEPEDQANPQIAEAVAYALHEKVVVVVPSSSAWGGRWIQALNGVVSVGAVGKEGWWLEPSPETTVGAPGVGLLVPANPGMPDDVSSGPSASAEVPAWLVAGMLADVAQKWPEVTGNQLIQTLVVNAASQPPPPPGKEDDWNYQSRGYGLADLPRMLAVDPTHYPDVNPLIVPDDGVVHGLTDEEIRAAGRPAWAPPLPTAAPGPSGPAGWVRPTLAAVVVAAVVTALAARARHVVRHRVRHDDSTAENDDPTTQDEE